MSDDSILAHWKDPSRYSCYGFFYYRTVFLELPRGRSLGLEFCMCSIISYSQTNIIFSTNANLFGSHLDIFRQHSGQFEQHLDFVKQHLIKNIHM